MLVRVEHYSKWIELVNLPQNIVELATTTFLDRVLPHFGAPTEALTDQGRDFLGVFEYLSTEVLIDHCTTLRDYLEVDGLAKQVILTSKCGLKKYGLLWGSHRDWDLILLWIAKGF